MNRPQLDPTKGSVFHGGFAKDAQGNTLHIVEPLEPSAGTESAQHAIESVAYKSAQITADMLPPLPGQWWEAQQGWYAGIMPALDDQPAYQLILDKDDLLAADGSAEHEWGNYGQDIKGSQSATDGWANTATMRQAGSPMLAALDDAKTDDIPFHDHYIPSKREMALIVATCSEHMTESELYWTSSQYSATSAWYQSFNLGNSGWIRKNGSLRVRPGRRLSL